MLNLLRRLVGNTPAVPAVLVGLGVGMAVNMALIQLNSTVLYPAPEGMDMNDPEQLQAYMDTLPAAAFLVVMAAHLGQALIGGWLAACLAVKRPVLLALIVGAFTMVGGIMMMTMVMMMQCNACRCNGRGCVRCVSACVVRAVPRACCPSCVVRGER